MAYTPDSLWRNRDQFLRGRDAIEAFLADKWATENGYRLRKELFAFTDDRVRIMYISTLTPPSLPSPFLPPFPLPPLTPYPPFQKHRYSFSLSSDAAAPLPSSYK